MWQIIREGSRKLSGRCLCLWWTWRARTEGTGQRSRAHGQPGVRRDGLNTLVLLGAENVLDIARVSVVISFPNHNILLHLSLRIKGSCSFSKKRRKNRNHNNLHYSFSIRNCAKHFAYSWGCFSLCLKAMLKERIVPSLEWGNLRFRVALKLL